MKKYLAFGLSIAVFISSPASGEFFVNMSKSQIYDSADTLTLNNLLVGDAASISYYATFCYGDDRKLFLSGYTEIVREKSDYSDYLRVTVLPGMKLSITIVPNKKGGDKIEAIGKLLKFIAASYKCDFWTAVYLGSQKMIEVADIEGTKSAKKLSEKMGVFR